MATEFKFGGRLIKEPGSYSIIRSLIQVAGPQVDYGTVLVIDCGENINDGAFGAGVSSLNAESPKDAIYQFNSLQEMQNAFTGGRIWKVAENIFRPSRIGVPGASKVMYVKAAVTTGATITYTFTGGGANGGVFACRTKTEGLPANGVASNSIIRRGFGARMRTGVTENHFVIDFYRGSFKGNDENGVPFNFITEAQSAPELIATSVEFDNIAELIAWAKTDESFNAFFTLTTQTVTGTGVVDSDDLTANSGNILAIGGTETYSIAHLNTALEALKDVYFSTILAPQIAASAVEQYNTRIASWVVEEWNYAGRVVIGGSSTLATVKTQAAAYNHQSAIVTHFKPKKNSNTVQYGMIKYNEYHGAAMVAGRIAGLPPQIPITFKDFAIDGIVAPLSEKQRIELLDAGVLHVKYDESFQRFIVNQGINTLQSNKNIINPDGQSHLIQIERIGSQLSNDLKILSKIEILGQENGPNANTVSPETLKAWTETKLKERTADRDTDNLLLGFRNVNVEKNQDSYLTTYEYGPNNEINKLFFIGNQVEL